MNGLLVTRALVLAALVTLSTAQAVAQGISGAGAAAEPATNDGGSWISVVPSADSILRVRPDVDYSRYTFVETAEPVLAAASDPAFTANDRESVLNSYRFAMIGAFEEAPIITTLPQKTLVLKTFITALQRPAHGLLRHRISHANIDLRCELFDGSTNHPIAELEVHARSKTLDGFKTLIPAFGQFMDAPDYAGRVTAVVRRDIDLLRKINKIPSSREISAHVFLRAAPLGTSF